MSAARSISTDASQDGTHRTLGREFRTPAHPDVLMALGRAQYNFMSLEETVVAIAYEAGIASLPQARGKMAGAKEKMLRELAQKYRAHSEGNGIANVLDVAADAFKEARELIRNKLSHAHPFTAGTDEDGNYLPGLAFTVHDGTSWATLSRTPEDLLDLASDVEKALNPLDEARMAVQKLPLAKLGITTQ